MAVYVCAYEPVSICVCVFRRGGGYIWVTWVCVHVFTCMGGGHPSMHLCSMREIILVYEISKQKTTVHDIHIKLSEQHT